MNISRREGRGGESRTKRTSEGRQGGGNCSSRGETAPRSDKDIQSSFECCYRCSQQFGPPAGSTHSLVLLLCFFAPLLLPQIITELCKPHGYQLLPATSHTTAGCMHPALRFSHRAPSLQIRGHETINPTKKYSEIKPEKGLRRKQNKHFVLALPQPTQYI